MYFLKRGRMGFARCAVASSLAGSVLALCAGTAMAGEVDWPVPEVKYDFTGFVSPPVMDPTGKIKVMASVRDLVQDVRTNGTRRGMGISGGSNGSEIDGVEVLEVTANPDGSAQGVSGVWLSNLYCGNDGDNGGEDCTVDDVDAPPSSGEQGSVEITFLDPLEGEICRAYYFTGDETLNKDGDDFGGNVEVEFGEVLQMVSARFSTNVPSTVGDGGYGPCNADTPSLPSPVGGNEFSVLGFVLDESEFIIDCAVGETCPAINIPGLNANIENSPSGTVKLANSEFVVDPRAICGTGGTDADGPLNIDVDDNGSTDIIIPDYMCGIPNVDDGIPQIWIQNVDSSLEFDNQFVDIVAADPANTAYSCETSPGMPNVRDRQPLQGWIPRWDDPDEVPVFELGTMIRERIIQDITTACSSYRSRSRALSYLAGNLHYNDLADFQWIVSSEIARLEQTVFDSFSCISNGRAQSTLSSDVGRIRKAFDQGAYPKTIKRLNEMTADLNGTRLSDPLKSCEFDPASDSIVPAGQGTKSALLWSYLLVQIEHLVFQIENKLLDYP